jgi:hypothetical protein
MIGIHKIEDFTNFSAEPIENSKRLTAGQEAFCAPFLKVDTLQG